MSLRALAKTSKNTQIERLYQKLPKVTNVNHFYIIIGYKIPKNTQVKIFMKIGQVNQKLPEGG